MKVFYRILFFLLLTNSLLAQIELVQDIAPGSASSGIRNLSAVNGLLFFEADTSDSDQLWVSDGTTEGTSMILINQDTADTSPNADPQNFTMYNGKVYFNANDGDKLGKDKELWVTDGTQAGTMLVVDINQDTTNSGDPRGSNPQEFFVFNDTLYFQANDGASTELWKYDGDTVLKATNISPNAFASVASPIIDTANNRVWLRANNGTTRNELFLFDGINATLVKDIHPTSSGYGGNGILFNGNLIFEGDDGTNGDELWVSDGTEAGTLLLSDINPGDANSDPNNFTIYNDAVYFSAETDTLVQLWKTDGTSEGTTLVATPYATGDADISNLFVFDDKLLFAATDGMNGVELWSYDGTTATMVKDINPNGDSNPGNFTELNNELYFTASSDTASMPELMVYSDTVALVSSLFDTTANPIDVNNLVVLNGQLFFTGMDTTNATGEELFVLTPRLTSSNYEVNPVDFSVYPNPSFDGLYYIKSEVAGPISFEIYDMNGRLLNNGTIRDNQFRAVRQSGQFIGIFTTNDNRKIVKRLMVSQ